MAVGNGKYYGGELMILPMAIVEDKIYLNVDGEIYDIERETLFTIGNEKLRVFVSS